MTAAASALSGLAAPTRKIAAECPVFRAAIASRYLYILLMQPTGLIVCGNFKRYMKYWLAINSLLLVVNPSMRRVYERSILFSPDLPNGYYITKFVVPVDAKV